MELAGAIVALAAAQPTHIGVDSQSFINKAEKTHDLIRKGQAPRRPWTLHSDGDLWESYYKHVRHRFFTP